MASFIIHFFVALVRKGDDTTVERREGRACGKLDLFGTNLQCNSGSLP